MLDSGSCELLQDTVNWQNWSEQRSERTNPQIEIRNGTAIDAPPCWREDLFNKLFVKTATQYCNGEVIAGCGAACGDPLVILCVEEELRSAFTSHYDINYNRANGVHDGDIAALPVTRRRCKSRRLAEYFDRTEVHPILSCYTERERRRCCLMTIHTPNSKVTTFNKWHVCEADTINLHTNQEPNNKNVAWVNLVLRVHGQ